MDSVASILSIPSLLHYPFRSAHHTSNAATATASAVAVAAVVLVFLKGTKLVSIEHYSQKARINVLVLFFRWPMRKPL